MVTPPTVVLNEAWLFWVKAVIRTVVLMAMHRAVRFANECFMLADSFCFSGSIVGSLRLHAPRKSRGLGFVKGARREAAAGPSGCQVVMRHTESSRVAEGVEGQSWGGNLTIHRGVRCRKACVPGVMG